jgi:hypothetical protein
VAIPGAKYRKGLGWQIQKIDETVVVAIHDHQAAWFDLIRTLFSLDRLSDDLQPLEFELTDIIFQDE